jgi:hypothetical protein
MSSLGMYSCAWVLEANASTRDMQQILQRTNTSLAIQKLRSQNTELVASSPPSTPNEGNADKRLSGETPRDLGSANKADKR